MSEIDMEWTADSAHLAEPIELRIGADLRNLPILRSLAASIASQVEFDVDAIADLRLAVDEACSTLIDAARAGSPVVCRFSVEESVVLRFDGAVMSTHTEPVNTNGFGWHVLSTLTSSAVSWLDSDPPDGASWLHIEITKGKVETSA